MTDKVLASVDRTVAPTSQYPGMTQIVRDGRCFQIAGVDAEAIALLEAHAECVLTGVAVPEYPSRRVWSQDLAVGDDAADAVGER
jgi:hypothetical protein